MVCKDMKVNNNLYSTHYQLLHKPMAKGMRKANFNSHLSETT